MAKNKASGVFGGRIMRANSVAGRKSTAADQIKIGTQATLSFGNLVKVDHALMNIYEYLSERLSDKLLLQVRCYYQSCSHANVNALGS